jgi:hypothetical protein
MFSAKVTRPDVEVGCGGGRTAEVAVAGMVAPAEAVEGG